jgi:lysine 2,3-aminomutase
MISETLSSSIEEAPEEPQEPPSKWVLKAPFYIQERDWENWHWQMANRLTSFSDLKKLKIEGLEEKEYKFPLSITPYYASLLYQKNINYPLCKTVIPSSEELIKSKGEEDDPLHEDDMSPVPGLVHRYPDRVLLLVTSICASYCRYCTRSRSVGEKNCYSINLEKAVQYISSHKSIRDVIISGGDPLSMDTSILLIFLQQIRLIPHIDVIRIGTKIPVVMPQRITSELVNSLKQFHPLYINIHFTHPDEITPEVSKACNMLADAGIVLGSQTVLLKGINDDAETMKKLMLGLVKMRVVPRYLYQCDPITGSKHFRTSVEKGLEIIDELQGFISGFAVPKFVIDAPKGGGKIPISTQTILAKDETSYKIKNYLGKVYEYPIE